MAATGRAYSGFATTAATGGVSTIRDWREFFDLDVGAPLYISEETRRLVWHSRVPGRTTDEKVRYLAEQYMERYQRAEDTVRGRGSWDSVRATILALACCEDCGAEGYIELFVTEEGWVYDDVECPLCGSRIVRLIHPFLPRGHLL